MFSAYLDPSRVIPHGPYVRSVRPINLMSRDEIDNEPETRSMRNTVPVNLTVAQRDKVRAMMIEEIRRQGGKATKAQMLARIEPVIPSINPDKITFYINQLVRAGKIVNVAPRHVAGEYAMADGSRK